MGSIYGPKNEVLWDFKKLWNQTNLEMRDNRNCPESPLTKNNINNFIIKNDFYRKSLNDALQFDIKDLHWIFSDISCAYSAGIIAANCKNIDISTCSNFLAKHR